MSAASQSRRLTATIDAFKAVIAEHTGNSFPQNPRVQLEIAVKTVFRSWRVGFTRKPSTGEPLANAQGVEIVAGIRIPVAIAESSEPLPAVYGWTKLLADA